MPILRSIRYVCLSLSRSSSSFLAEWRHLLMATAKWLQKLKHWVGRPPEASGIKVRGSGCIEMRIVLLWQSWSRTPWPYFDTITLLRFASCAWPSLSGLIRLLIREVGRYTEWEMACNALLLSIDSCKLWYSYQPSLDILTVTSLIRKLA